MVIFLIPFLVGVVVCNIIRVGVWCLCCYGNVVDNSVSGRNSGHFIFSLGCVDDRATEI